MAARVRTRNDDLSTRLTPFTIEPTKWDQKRPVMCQGPTEPEFEPRALFRGAGGLFHPTACLVFQALQALSPGSLLWDTSHERSRGPALAPYRLCQDGAVLVTLCLQGALGLLGLPQLAG